MVKTPTISIHANGRVQHTVYLDDASLRDVLLECIDIVKRIRDVTNSGDLLARLGEDPERGDDGFALELRQMFRKAGPLDFEAVIDLTDHVVAYEGLDGTFEDVKWWKPLVSTPEEYDAAAKVGGWPKEALILRDVPEGRYKHAMAVNRTLAIGILKDELIALVLADDRERDAMMADIVAELGRCLVPVRPDRPAYPRDGLKSHRACKYSNTHKRAFEL